MSFDCQFKIRDGQCRRINKECNPGVKGCILYGRFSFPLKEEEGKKDEKIEKKKS
ncbi:MAG: hypothetical protein JXR86_04050 [Spirochaetales bacterium]|nr:hypothetical protein [Spirochaetales bacterium]